ncbi:MAG: nicotinamide-nucleotide amidohydrolase family protein [Silvanigrellaceae bacterium]
MIKLSARWLKNEHPFELEFEGYSEEHLHTRTGASSAPGTPKRYHSPKDLVALGIAGCTGVDVVSILAKMRQPLEAFVVETELTQTTEHPRVFDSCRLVYRLAGSQLEPDRVARAVALSYGKYCGVSAMIKKSGCHFEPRLFLNDQDITNDFEQILAEIVQSEVQLRDGKSNAALLITGNEILFGKTQETNGRFLARNLISAGFGISELRVVGDQFAQLAEALQSLLLKNDLVFITGGLGPTKDDLTSEVVAKVVSAPLSFSEEAWNVCLRAFERMGRKEVPESNRKQALLPEGALVLANSQGTAAGFVVNHFVDGKPKTICALPGVPWECEEMFQNEVRRLLPKSKQRIREWGPWNIWGVGESALQSLIGETESAILKKLPHAEFSFQAHAGYVTYVIRSEFDDESEMDVDLAEEVSSLESLFGDRLLYRNGAPLIPHLLSLATNLGVSLSLAESCTGGRIASELTSVSGSSEVFSGGLVAYSNEVKKSALGVQQTTLSDFGAVSLPTAVEMAAGSARLFNSNVALSVTGIAGPGGGTESKPVGTVCFALSLEGLFKSGRFDKITMLNNMSRLQVQGWNLQDEDKMILAVEKRFGAFLGRDIVQKRSALFGLCSLLAVLEILRSPDFK